MKYQKVIALPFLALILISSNISAEEIKKKQPSILSKQIEGTKIITRGLLRKASLAVGTVLACSATGGIPCATLAVVTISLGTNEVIKGAEILGSN